MWYDCIPLDRILDTANTGDKYILVDCNDSFHHDAPLDIIEVFFIVVGKFNEGLYMQLYDSRYGYRELYLDDYTENISSNILQRRLEKPEWGLRRIV